MATLEQPLDPEDFDRIEQAIKKTQELERAINTAKRAGINVEDRLAQVREARAKLQQIKQTYKPG